MLGSCLDRFEGRFMNALHHRLGLWPPWRDQGDQSQLIVPSTYRTCLAPGLAGTCHSLGPKQMSKEVLGRVIMSFLRRDTQDRNFVIPATPGRRFCESCACSSPVSSVFTLKDGAPSQECMKNAGFIFKIKRKLRRHVKLRGSVRNP